MHWYGVTFECPKDRAPCILRVAAFSADLELCFTFQCGLCNETFNWRIYASALAHRALEQDMQADRKAKKLDCAVSKEIARIVKPPLAPKPEGFTEDDLKLLKEFHVTDEETS